MALNPKAQLLVAVAVPAAISAKHVTVSSAGQVITGGSLAIVNVCMQDAVLPQSSVTV